MNDEELNKLAKKVATEIWDRWAIYVGRNILNASGFSGHGVAHPLA